MYNSRLEESYSTPMKPDQGNTTIGNYQSHTKDLVESKYQQQVHDNHHENERQEKEHHKEQDQELDSIQAQIKTIGRELEELHYQMIQNHDRYSEEYLHQEQTRNTLRKRLIDLDYTHKTVFARRIRHGYQQEQQEKINLQKSIEEKYSRIYEVKPTQTKQESSQHHSEASQIKSENNQEIRSNQEKEDLGSSRRQLRISEIEAELAESRLRRSRMQLLNSELEYLQSSYRLPYSYFRDYYLPTYSYPYSTASIYSRWWLY